MDNENLPLKPEDIFIPGAKFEARKLTEEEVKEMAQKMEAAQDKLEKSRRWTQRDYDQLQKRITI